MGLISIEGYGDYDPKHLSFSTLSTYRMCAKKFFFQKVLQLEEKPGLAAIGGNAIHTATEHIDRLILEHGLEALRPSASTETDTRNTERVPTREETGF